MSDSYRVEDVVARFEIEIAELRDDTSKLRSEMKKLNAEIGERSATKSKRRGWLRTLALISLVPVYFLMSGVTAGVLERSLPYNSVGRLVLGLGWPVTLPIVAGSRLMSSESAELTVDDAGDGE